MKKKSVCILLIFAAVIVLTYVTGESYYRGISEKAGLDKQEEKIYKYQYDMIVDSPDSQFWQAVYDSAKKKAAPNNVLIEIMGPDRSYYIMKKKTPQHIRHFLHIKYQKKQVYCIEN